MKNSISDGVIESLYATPPEELMSKKFPAEIIFFLNNHTTEDRLNLTRLSRQLIRYRTDGHTITLSMDFKQLAIACKQVELNKSRRDLEDAFLSKGASNACMNALFKMAKSSAIARRKVLGIDIKSPGRPNAEDINHIIYLWGQKKALKSDIRKTILDIHKVTGHSITVIWNAINGIEKSDKTTVHEKYVESV